MAVANLKTDRIEMTRREFVKFKELIELEWTPASMFPYAGPEEGPHRNYWRGIPIYIVDEIPHPARGE